VKARAALGIRPIDVALTGLVIAVVELNVVVGTGAGASPLDSLAYLMGAILPLPILLRRRWPLQVLIACSVLLFAYYSSGPPQEPVAGAAAYGSAVRRCGGGVPDVGDRYPRAVHGDRPVRRRRILSPGTCLTRRGFSAQHRRAGVGCRARRGGAGEGAPSPRKTAQRLQLADEEREAETARRVAEERLRIARELHDTVAHSMATIAVQAGSALHVLRPAGHTAQIRGALTAIRDTSKSALAEMRSTLGQLRSLTPSEPGEADLDAGAGRAGLHRLTALCDAVQAAGVPVRLTVDGEAVVLPEQVDHAAYRILQESLTNVLRHAGPGVTAYVCLRYQPGVLTLRVSDDGAGHPAPGAGTGQLDGGHGLAGMRERATSAGGDFSAGPRQGGGFEVFAHLPVGGDRPHP